MSFAVVAIATSIVALILGAGWLLAGNLVLKRWGIEATALGLLVGRRIGAVYLGMAAMLFLGRSAPPSDLRTAVCGGMVVALAVLAGLSVFEFAARRARAGILVSAVIEAVLAAGFVAVILV